MGTITPVSMLNSKPRIGFCIPSSENTSKYSLMMARITGCMSSGQSRHWMFLSISAACISGLYCVTSSRGGRGVLSCRSTFPLSAKSQSTSPLVSGSSSGSSYAVLTRGLQTRLGTSTGFEPSGCTPSFAMRSSSAVAEVAASVSGRVDITRAGSVSVDSSTSHSSSSSSSMSKRDPSSSDESSPLSLLGSSVVYASS
jgi:hypothetical protein